MGGRPPQRSSFFAHDVPYVEGKSKVEDSDFPISSMVCLWNFIQFPMFTVFFAFQLWFIPYIPVFPYKFPCFPTLSPPPPTACFTVIIGRGFRLEACKLAYEHDPALRSLLGVLWGCLKSLFDSFVTFIWLAVFCSFGQLSVDRWQFVYGFWQFWPWGNLRNSYIFTKEIYIFVMLGKFQPLVTFIDVSCVQVYAVSLSP